MSASSPKEKCNDGVYSVLQYMADKVNYKIPAGVLAGIFLSRGIEAGDNAESLLGDSDGKSRLELATADIYKWIVLGPTRRGTVSDTDNGWTHSDGGWSLSEADKKRLMAEANALYKKNGEDESCMGRVGVRVRSLGIMHSMYDMQGMPVPRVYDSKGKRKC